MIPNSHVTTQPKRGIIIKRELEMQNDLITGSKKDSLLSEKPKCKKSLTILPISDRNQSDTKSAPTLSSILKVD